MVIYIIRHTHSPHWVNYQTVSSHAVNSNQIAIHSITEYLSDVIFYTLGCLIAVNVYRLSRSFNHATLELLQSIDKFISHINTSQLLYSESLTKSLLFLLQVLLHFYMQYAVIHARVENKCDMYQQTLLKYLYASISDVNISKVTLYNEDAGTQHTTGSAPGVRRVISITLNDYLD